MDKSQELWTENIEMKPAMVINDFAQCREGKLDPLDEIDNEQPYKDGSAFKGLCNKGIEAYF